MKPPTGGPTSGPTRPGMVSQAMAETRSLLGVDAHQHEARDRRHHRAAHALQEARHDEGCGSESAMAQAIEPSTKTPIAARNTRLAPNRSAIQPLIGMKMASDTR